MTSKIITKQKRIEKYILEIKTKFQKPKRDLKMTKTPKNVLKRIVK